MSTSPAPDEEGMTALGRYGPPASARWLAATMACVLSILATVELLRGGGSGFWLVLAAVWIIVSIASLLIATTVITDSGIRTLLHRVRWADVAEVPEPHAPLVGSRAPRVVVVLRDGRKVLLPGVGMQRVSALRRLAVAGAEPGQDDFAR